MATVRMFKVITDGYYTVESFGILIPWSRVLLEKLQSLSWSRKYCTAMQPEGRLSYSHVPAVGTYAGRGECNSLRLHSYLYPGFCVAWHLQTFWLQFI
jgi:hypothetical protein